MPLRVAHNTDAKAELDVSKVGYVPLGTKLGLEQLISGASRCGSDHVVDVDGDQVGNSIVNMHIYTPFTQQAPESPCDHGLHICPAWFNPYKLFTGFQTHDSFPFSSKCFGCRAY
jgi:hypothetical protein